MGLFLFDKHKFLIYIEEKFLMGLFKIKSNTLVSEKNNLRFNIKRIDGGTIGVFQDYPNAKLVLEAIESSINSLSLNLEESFSSREKKKFILSIDGKEITYFIKGKLWNRFIKDRDYKKSVTALRDRDAYDFETSNFSVLYELFANRRAAERYQRKFKTDLGIEKAVGFYICTQKENQGTRFVIFEHIPNMIYELTDGIRRDMELYEVDIRLALNSVGVINKAPFKRIFDLVPVTKGKGIDFVIVDSEDWYIKKI